MKKLCSPFKGLNADNFIVFSLSIAFILSGSSCSSRMSISDESNDVARTGGAMPVQSPKLISIVDSVKENWIEIRSANSPQTPGFLRMSAKSCIDQKFSFNSTLEVLGVGYDMVFEEEAGQLSLVTIEDSETKLIGVLMPQEIKESACQALRSSHSEFIVVNEDSLSPIRNTLKEAMIKITPDCKSVEFAGRVARCALDSLLPQPALVKTEDFQRAMIRKWSRQPYILARRTGVVSTLAKTATYMSNDEGFAKFCKVLQFSLPEELPVVMTSRRWQNALCSGRGDLRREAALYGLAKGTQELAMLRQLYEGVSRVGLLSVKIPTNIIPGRVADVNRQPLRITISPDDEVSDRLVAEAKKYLGRSERDEQPKKLVRHKFSKRGHRHAEPKPIAAPLLANLVPTRSDMCWHPVFAESWGLMRIADGMKLTGDGFNMECGFIYEHEDGEAKELAALSRYLLQSLSSETEFVLDNGQSKLLRLPHGNYQYTVKVLPANPLDTEELDEENTPSSSGEIAWGSLRNLSIKQW